MHLRFLPVKARLAHPSRQSQKRGTTLGVVRLAQPQRYSWPIGPGDHNV